MGSVGAGCGCRRSAPRSVSSHRCKRLTEAERCVALLPSHLLVVGFDGVGATELGLVLLAQLAQQRALAALVLREDALDLGPRLSRVDLMKAEWGLILTGS